MAHRFLISQDSPVLYITLVTKDRLPVFPTNQMKEVLCKAIDEARSSAHFLLFAYVIMLDHYIYSRAGQQQQLRCCGL